VTIDNTSKSTSPIRVVVSLLKRFPIQIISFAVTLLSFFSLTSLGAYHCMLISMAETTNERVRRVYEKNGGTSNPNDQVRIFFFFPHCVLFLLPHSNQGSVIKNARKMFGKSSRIKSRLGDMSRVVELDSEVCLPVGSGPEDITI